ncbi:hypothetical protein IWZ03DRAFT_99033 [Phyllosticta citriasiana]|uniref:Uncharacterized protein n=1 Tax=Phyllosticta citriasiana TaxID=595635 RepID=A0ABR1KYL3_9PEZI
MRQSQPVERKVWAETRVSRAFVVERVGWSTAEGRFGCACVPQKMARVAETKAAEEARTVDRQRGRIVGFSSESQSKAEKEAWDLIFLGRGWWEKWLTTSCTASIFCRLAWASVASLAFDPLPLVWLWLLFLRLTWALLPVWAGLGWAVSSRHTRWHSFNTYLPVHRPVPIPGPNDAQIF